MLCLVLRATAGLAASFRCRVPGAGRRVVPIGWSFGRVAPSSRPAPAGMRRPRGRWPAPRPGSGHGDGPVLLGGDPADDLVHQAVLLGLGRREVAVALGVPGDPLDRLAGVPGQDLVDGLLAL